MDMVWPLWNLACGGQRGLRTWVSLKSARKAPRLTLRAEMVKRIWPREIILLWFDWVVGWRQSENSNSRKFFADMPYFLRACGTRRVRIDGNG